MNDIKLVGNCITGPVNGMNDMCCGNCDHMQRGTYDEYGMDPYCPYEEYYEEIQDIWAEKCSNYKESI